MLSPRARLWWDRLVRFFAGASGIVVGALAGVLRNKWLAMHLEASGIGIVSQVVAALSWLGAAAGLGLGLPVSRAVGAATGRGDDAAARRATWTAFSLTLAAGLPIALLGLLFAERVSIALLGTPEHANLVRVSMLGVIGVGLFQVAQGASAGRSDVRAPLLFALGGASAITLLTFALVPRFGLLGATTAVALLYPAGCATLLVAHGRRHPVAFHPRPRPALDPPEAKALLSVAGAALVLPLLDQGTLLALRAHFLRENGVAANGLLQAALALSQQVGALFYAYLASYAFGKISGAGGPDGIRSYTRRQWAPLIALAALAVALAMVAAAPLLRILYSSRFDPARPMMAFALFGEFGRVCLQACALGSLPLGGTRLWVRIGVVQPVALAAAYALFAASGSGPLSLPRAYAAAGVFTFATGALLMARAGLSLGGRNLALAGGAYAGLAVLLRAVTG
jgi:Na+-driven multidrug efflux pump